MGHHVEIPKDRATRKDLPQVCVLTGSRERIVWFRLGELDLPMDEAARDGLVARSRAFAAGASFAVVSGAMLAHVFLADLVSPDGDLLFIGVAVAVLLGALVAITLGSPRIVRRTATAVVVSLPAREGADAFREALALPVRAAPPPGSRCARHDAPAGFTCPRCGAFACGACGGDFCLDCAARLRDEEDRAAARLEDEERRSLTWKGLVALVPLNLPFKLATFFTARSLARTAKQPRTITRCRLFTITSVAGSIVDTLIILLL